MYKARPQFSVKELKTATGISDLIHKFGHDVGNPLTAVISLTSLLERLIDDLEKQGPSETAGRTSSFVQSIAKEAWRIGQLNDRLVLLLSDKNEFSGALDLENSLDRACNKLAQHGAIPEGVELDIDFRPPTSAPLIESGQFEALVCELVRNAAEALNRCGIASSTAPQEINILCAEEGEQILLKIKNLFKTEELSEKISNKTLDDLFRPFVRGTSITPTSSGLGLAAAWAVVERFGGELELSLEDAPELDNLSLATISVKLPAKRRAQLDTPETRGINAPSKASSSNISPPSTELSKYNVVVIEDEPSVSGAIEKIVKFHFNEKAEIDFHIFTGSEACEHILNSNPDLIISDYSLADCKADKIAEALVNKPILLEKLIIMSGDIDSPEMKSFREKYSCALLRKPFEVESLLDLIDASLEI